MAYYTCNVIIGAIATVSPMAVLRVGAYAVNIRFITYYNTSSTAGGIGWGLKGAGTTTPSASQLFTPLDSRKPASVDNIDTAWSATPVIPPTWLGRVPVPNVNGAGNVFSYQKDGPLVLDPAAQLAFFNWTAAATGTGMLSIELEL